jgi:RNA-directed DNA polymerase
MEKIPNSQEGWNRIHWATVGAHVRKLQKRIYFASKNGDIKTVRRLQHNLVNSHHSKLLATRRVTQENKDKKTAGIDGIKLLKPAERIVIAKNIGISGNARALRRVWIDKSGKTEKRPLGIPTMDDRINQALFKLALEPEWEAKFEPHSYGFRPGRGCHDAIKQIYISIRKMPKYVLDADIRKCFDKIDHSKLLSKLNFKGTFHSQIEAWLKSGVVDQEVFTETDSGTAQGGVISPLLANIALHGMETMLKDLMKEIPLRTPNGRSMGTRDKQRSLSIIRYADDFVVMHYDKQVILKCKVAIQSWLNEIGLELSEEKTRITHTLELTPEDKEEFKVEKPGFDFLGFNIFQRKSKYGRGQINGINTIILPSTKKCKTHQEKLALLIRNSSMLSQEVLIQKLNPIISGWSRYFGLSDAITYRVLQKMDYLLYLKLRRWAKRKTKSAAAGIKKYWKHSTTWEFKTESGIALVKHTDYARSIRDYVKVKGECSPYDGQEIYWSSRLGTNPLMSRSQAMLLKKQGGKCNLCKLRLLEEDILEIDHIIPLKDGGRKNYQNVQIVHRHCHDQKASFLTTDLISKPLPGSLTMDNLSE